VLIYHIQILFYLFIYFIIIYYLYYPTTIYGFVVFSVWILTVTGSPPPKKHSTLMFFKNFPSRWNSSLAYCANSRVWAITRHSTFSLSELRLLSTVSTKTAVLPVPDLAWHINCSPCKAFVNDSVYTNHQLIFCFVSLKNL